MAWANSTHEELAGSTLSWGSRKQKSPTNQSPRIKLNKNSQWNDWHPYPENIPEYVTKQSWQQDCSPPIFSFFCFFYEKKKEIAPKIQITDGPDQTRRRGHRQARYRHSLTLTNRLSLYKSLACIKLHILQRGCPQSARETSTVGLAVHTRYLDR